MTIQFDIPQKIHAPVVLKHSKHTVHKLFPIIGDFSQEQVYLAIQFRF